MRLVKGNILLLAILVGVSGCDWLQSQRDNANTGKPIAKVADQVLYEDDLEGLYPEGASTADSTDRVESYINNWIEQQLLIKEASEAIDFNEAEIDRKVLDYKYALMVHEYEKLKVNEQLSMEVSDEEVKAYYEAKYREMSFCQSTKGCPGNQQVWTHHEKVQRHSV